MKRILIVGGANGIGLSIAIQLAMRPETEKIYIVDRAELRKDYQSSKIQSQVFDLNNQDYSIFDHFPDIDSLLITAGFGQLALFEDIPEEMLNTYFTVNTIAFLRQVARPRQLLLWYYGKYCWLFVFSFLFCLCRNQGCFAHIY